MKTKSFYPAKKSEQIAWTKNFKTQIAVEGPKLNEPAADIASAQADCQSIEDQTVLVQAAEENLRQVKATANAFIVPAESRLRKYASRVKTNALYTEEIGQILGIANVTVLVDISAIVPRLTIKINGGHPELSFSMANIDGVNIYSRTNAVGNFTLIGTAGAKPWLDMRTLTAAGVPELREYYIMVVVKNQEKGQQSAVVSILYKG